MAEESYLSWVIRNTKTRWWHDSADPRELELGLERGAVGVTTNPFLSNLAVGGNRSRWAAEVRSAVHGVSDPELKAENLMRIAVTGAARLFLPLFEQTGGRHGHVCAQVNPSRAGDRARMMAMARRFHAWAPNIAVKLPATAAGLDVLEECIAEGITATATVSFTVPQVIAVAERHRAGIRRARAAGREPGNCYAVLMAGRLDDYLREVADDASVGVTESDIQQAGIAVTKRTCAVFAERGYEAQIIVAALRGVHHMTELAGAPVIMSIAPGWQQPLLSTTLPKEERAGREVAPDVIERLSRLPDFVRAYEADGMKPAQFISYGLTQRTLGQFIEAGWRLLEVFQP